MDKRRLWAVILAAALVATVAVGVLAPWKKPAPAAPIRAAFYYDWFPETEGWATKYSPTLGKYDSSNPSVNAVHISMAKYAGLDAFITSWWGAGSDTDQRLPALLDAAQAQDFKVAPYYEQEVAATDRQLTADLNRLVGLSSSPAWLRVRGKPVLFIYNAAAQATCAAVQRYMTASGGRFYLNMKVFDGYQSCPTQPDSWHQYGPAIPSSDEAPYSFVVSPGFYKFNESRPRLERNLSRFTADLVSAKSSGAQWQLVTSFNEWGEGSAVEPAYEWQSASGFGSYLDAMRSVFLGLPSP